MGSMCCGSAENQANDKINGYMDSEARKSQQMKLLLLGCGSAGKSTLFKSLRISHAGGLDPTDLVSIVPLIRHHCVQSILKLFCESQSLYKNDSNIHKDCFVESTQEIKQAITNIEEFRTNVCLDDQTDEWESIDFELMSNLAKHIDFIWKLPGIQATYRKRGKYFAFEDNSNYYLNKIEYIFDQNFEPTEEDYLKAKQRTIGMIDYEYQAPISKCNFRIIDVGGQRSERRKWISLFSNVDGLIFVAALSSYNAVLYEDGVTNGMLEAVKVFYDIIKKKFFDNCNIILCLNKNDIFRNMIKEECVPLSRCFSYESNWPFAHEYFTYDDENDVKNQMPFQSDGEFEEYYCEALQHIKSVFHSRNKKESRHIYTHVTVATDNQIVTRVFADVQNIIIKRVLKNFGMVDGSFANKKHDYNIHYNTYNNISNTNEIISNHGEIGSSVHTGTGNGTGHGNGKDLIPAHVSNHMKNNSDRMDLELNKNDGNDTSMQRVHSTETSVVTEDDSVRRELPPMKTLDLEKL